MWDEEERNTIGSYCLHIGMNIGISVDFGGKLDRAIIVFYSFNIPNYVIVALDTARFINDLSGQFSCRFAENTLL